MQRFKNILCVFPPGSRPAVWQRAVSLAQKNQARLTLLDVVEDLPPDAKLLLTEVPLAALQQTGVKERKERLNAMLVPCQRQNQPVRADVTVGVPFLEIIRRVLRDKHDLVIKAGEAGAGPRGGTDSHLLRKCPCPVWLMERAGRRVGRVLAAVEPGSQDDTADSLNHRIVELAFSLGRMEKAVVYVANAWFHFSAAWGFRLRRPQKAAYGRDLVNARQKWLNALVAAHAGKKDRWQAHLIQGNPGPAIPKLARKLRADLVVMGTLARSGVPGFFMGNTAEEMLHHLPGSVLAVKPDWFVSPVRLEGDGP